MRIKLRRPSAEIPAQRSVAPRPRAAIAGGTGGGPHNHRKEAVILLAGAAVFGAVDWLLLPAAWQIPVATIPVLSTVGAITVYARGAAAQEPRKRRWTGWRPWRPASTAVTEATQHPDFDIEAFLTALEAASVIVFSDTVSVLLSEPSLRPRTIDALRRAYGRGAAITIVLLCPCSRALKDRARRLGRDLRVQAEESLTALDQLWQDLARPGAERYRVYLHSMTLPRVEYRLDDVIQMSTLDARRSHECPHLQYSADSPVGRDSVRGLEAHISDNCLPLPEHMRGVLDLTDADGVTVLREVEHLYFEDDDGERAYVALRDPAHVRVATQSESAVWRHGNRKALNGVLIRVEGPGTADRRRLLQAEYEKRYHTGARPDFFEVRKASP